ncbi:hypothetical protein CPB83DRAFT_848792 [Crepidotus variabilis]|uniref:Uncharacterized protein n=1 Tax=Crepidotus variabilis TaxID=179855 RepID=A0A9P6EMY0_9AGAR|nr:hypothetical protein CPB83DRAFT_848792 [Crepidotus variabilis]
MNGVNYAEVNSRMSSGLGQLVCICYLAFNILPCVLEFFFQKHYTTSVSDVSHTK